MNRLTTTVFSLLIGSVLTNTACTEKEPPLPDNLVQFESSALGLGADENELTIQLLLSRAPEVSGMVSIQLETNGLTYGEVFSTQPEANTNLIQIPTEATSTSVSFKVLKAADALLDGDETIVFTITEVTGSLLVGTQKTLTLSFSEILAQQGLMNINGGGPDFPNKVFIDLSANRQTAVLRTLWDLGFYSGDDFRVILNSSTGMMARPLAKTDLASVTAQDTLGFANQMSFNAFSTAAYAWIDNPEGDLTKTAIEAIPANASESKVYIIQRGSGVNGQSRGWKKIKVIRNGNGYTVQHADINSGTVSELQIAKNDQFLFNYIHFENGAVEVEPAKNRWDIAWTGFTFSTPYSGGVIPYYYQDIVIQNRFGVETAQLMIAETGSYENFSSANLNQVQWSNSQVAIGASWRSGGGPGAVAANRSDRFYVVKDAEGNIYKLRFTALTQDGQRGRPQIEFELL